MHYNAATEITDYTSSVHFCVVRSLALNQYAVCGEMAVLKLEGYCAY